MVDDDVARQLIKRCAERDERALEHLHRLVAKRIFLFANHRLNSEADAKGVVVETLWEVWRSAHKFRGESSALTWILGIAKNRSSDVFRAAGPAHDDIDDHVEDLVSEVETPEEQIVRLEDDAHLSDCIAALPPAHRECVQLVYFENLGLADVARVQSVPENTVKTRLFHARSKLRRCVERCASPN